MALPADTPSPDSPDWAAEAVQVLVRAGGVLGASLDYHTTLNSLVELLVPRLADGCVVRLLDTEERLPQVHVSHRDPAVEELLRDYYRRILRTDRGEPELTRRLVEQGEAVLVPEVSPDAIAGLTTPEWRELVTRIGLRSLLAVPMVVGGRTIGVLSLGTTISGRRYGEQDIPLVRELAARAATAVDHARLYHAEREARALAELSAEEMRRLHDYQERLYTIIAGLDRQRTFEDAARFISDTAAGAIGATASWVGRVDQTTRSVIIVSARGYPPDVLERYRSFGLDHPTPAADAVRSGKPVFLPDLAARRAAYPALGADQARIGPGALAAIPLVVEGRVTGAMGYTFAEDRPFIPVEREFLQAIATHAAIALDRLELDAELRDASEQLEQVLAAAKMGTWVWEIATGSVTWDDNLAAVFALPPGRAITTYDEFLALVHPDDRRYVQAVVPRTVSDGMPLDYEFRAVCPDGVTRWLAVQGRIFVDEGGAPAYLAGVCVDVTDRKVAEAQLREAQKMEAVGRLAGGMAHEINNMMSVVLGFTEFLGKDESLSPTALDDVSEIRRAAERAAGVTRQVLAFSRQQVMVTETLELNGVIAGAEQLLRRVLGSRIEVVVSLAADTGHVRADPNQLSQVLVNLALNARDAMVGTGRLTIRTRGRRLRERDLRGDIGIDIVPGDYVELVVSDTGHGMDAATRARAFEPFFTTKAVGEGTGLGLSTVYGIVKQSHGYVWAESAPGRGTEFHLVFPRVEAEAEAVSPAFGARSAATRATGTRVLLVEDEPMVRSIARRSLESAGYEVVEAEDGVGALGVLAAGEQVELVLTDIIMPRMTGRELGRQVRQRWPRLPVLYMSGHPSEEMVRRGLLLQGEQFVQKPFHPERLADEVGRALGHSHSAAEPA